MKHKIIEVERNKKIEVFDDVFDLNFRQQMFMFVENSLFQLGWSDGSVTENQKYKFLHSIYSTDDVIRCGLVNELNKSGISEILEKEKVTLVKTVVNLSTPADFNFLHAHPEKKVLLYYPNLVWEDGWHGETLFYNETCDEVVFASAYTPGRIVLFDGNIPHTIRPQSVIATKYRFTLALIFDIVTQ
jgi:hypothetical protein